ncbi:uncharacterized protein RCO7_09374 [Rhynchosporium graminicola]|uniref:Methylated-DNA--protein-cysteine methyltransferase n=1 Tax=Rhynchosporium graminicola TaxID=2792576 RepID=A0A1E1KWU0_9HELO|nr:uncharacterized protein RCO7_09374 [Rhynchosporium commune]
MANKQAPLEQLQNEWKQMFQKTLPQAAQSKSPSQSSWPVHVDHCFARIILDNEIGITTPWMSVLKSPAYKNMTREQLESCIELGRKILDGEADLVELDERSLKIRGKEKEGGKKRKAGENLEGGKVKESRSKKREAEPSVTSEAEAKSSPRSAEEELDLDSGSGSGSDPKKTEPGPSNSSKPEKDVSPKSDRNKQGEDLTPYLKKIALSEKTPFQKKVLSALCQVPRGQYTTYGGIAKHLSSSARAVGNSIRNNPFAPYVPCHRVLASGGGLGGFGGSWGKKGEAGLNDDKKRKLLREEGVKFDGKGIVVGKPWEGFT